MQIKKFWSNEKLHLCECINDFLGAVAEGGNFGGRVGSDTPPIVRVLPSFHQDVCFSGQWRWSFEFMLKSTALQVRLVTEREQPCRSVRLVSQQQQPQSRQL